jgi:hypothetical protein
MRRSERHSTTARGGRRVGLLVAAGLLTACSSPSDYAATAMKLAGTEHPAPTYGLSKAWKPLGKSHAYTPSDQENVRMQFFLDSCVSELTARFKPTPSRAVQAVQIGECMQARGWHLVLEERIAASASR